MSKYVPVVFRGDGSYGWSWPSFHQRRRRLETALILRVPEFQRKKCFVCAMDKTRDKYTARQWHRNWIIYIYKGKKKIALKTLTDKFDDKFEVRTPEGNRWDGSYGYQTMIKTHICMKCVAKKQDRYAQRVLEIEKGEDKRRRRQQLKQAKMESSQYPEVLHAIKYGIPTRVPNYIIKYFKKKIPIFYTDGSIVEDYIIPLANIIK